MKKTAIDIELSRDGELMVVAEGLSEEGSEFLDAYMPSHEYTVVDSGRILVPMGELERLITAAIAQGLLLATNRPREVDSGLG